MHKEDKNPFKIRVLGGGNLGGLGWRTGAQPGKFLQVFGPFLDPWITSYFKLLAGFGTPKIIFMLCLQMFLYVNV